MVKVHNTESLNGIIYGVTQDISHLIQKSDLDSITKPAESAIWIQTL